MAIGVDAGQQRVVVSTVALEVVTPLPFSTVPALIVPVTSAYAVLESVLNPVIAVEVVVWYAINCDTAIDFYNHLDIG